MEGPNRFNADGLVYAARYADTMNGIVLPELEKRAVHTTVRGADGRPIACTRYDAQDPCGTVAVLHGFTESAAKFSELTHSLLACGFSVLAYDQRGHGYSWHSEGLSDGSLTHVDRFDEYVRDLRAVAEGPLAEMPKPYGIFAHSMGGAVTALFLESCPGVFSRAALCAPMIAPDRGGRPMWAARLLCGAARLAGQGKKRVFFAKPYDGHERFESSAAACRERFDWYDGVKFATPAYQNNSPSYSWTLEALNVTRKILRPGGPEGIDCPVRLYSAENDTLVLRDAQERFIRRVRDGAIRSVAGSKHEIFNSPDEVLFPWWHEVIGFLKGTED